jgi:hypothetical protein
LRKRTLTDAEVVEMYLSGVDSFTVGLRGNLDPTTVLALVRAAGHQVRNRGGRKPLTALAIPIDQAIRLYNDGLSVQSVADKAGVDRATMAQAFQRAGVKMRTPQEAANLRRYRTKG